MLEIYDPKGPKLFDNDYIAKCTQLTKYDTEGPKLFDDNYIAEYIKSDREKQGNPCNIWYWEL